MLLTQFPIMGGVEIYVILGPSTGENGSFFSVEKLVETSIYDADRGQKLLKIDLDNFKHNRNNVPINGGPGLGIRLSKNSTLQDKIKKYAWYPPS